MDSEQNIYTRCQQANLILVHIRPTEPILHINLKYNSTFLKISSYKTGKNTKHEIVHCLKDHIMKIYGDRALTLNGEKQTPVKL
jgi:hypothetical protein